MSLKGPQRKPYLPCARLRKVDKEAGTVLKEMALGGGAIWALMYSTDGEKLAAACHDTHLLILDPTLTTILQDIHVGGGGIWQISYSPQGNLLVAGCHDGLVRTMSTESGCLLGVVSLSRGPVCSFAFEPQDSVDAAKGGRNRKTASGGGACASGVLGLSFACGRPRAKLNQTLVRSGRRRTAKRDSFI